MESSCVLGSSTRDRGIKVVSPETDTPNAGDDGWAMERRAGPFLLTTKTPDTAHMRQLAGCTTGINRAARLRAVLASTPRSEMQGAAHRCDGL